MRYITALGVAALALSMSGTGMTCSAQQAPSGSYQQTCRDIGVRGSSLYASCQDTGGGWRSTQLSDFQRCNGEIQNLNGNLQCTGDGNGNRQDNNGYRQEGNNNNNDARDGNGNRDRDHNGDQNHDGDQDRRRDGDNGYNNVNGNNRYGNNDVPSGSYAQTCQNITVNGNTLQASCQKKNGKWKNASLQNYNRCNRQIENVNGKLSCR